MASDVEVFLVRKPRLFSYWNSSCSWRVRIALNLKGIQYSITPISLTKDGGQQHCNEYRDVNPMELVPSLQIDNLILIESLAIMHYLDETRPMPPLLPRDPLLRAKVREICEVISSGTQPLHSLVVLLHVGKSMKDDWTVKWITRGLKAVEKLLEKSAGKYCVGDMITMADCCLVPQLFTARKYQVDVEPYPIMLRIEKTLENHPAFVVAHAFNQPDYDAEQLSREAPTTSSKEKET